MVQLVHRLVIVQIVKTMKTS